MHSTEQLAFMSAPLLGGDMRCTATVRHSQQNPKMYGRIYFKQAMQTQILSPLEKELSILIAELQHSMRL